MPAHRVYRRSLVITYGCQRSRSVERHSHLCLRISLEGKGTEDVTFLFLLEGFHLCGRGSSSDVDLSSDL